MVFDNPARDPATANFDRDPAFAKEKLAGILDPDNPDLTLFGRRGGKLIVCHGWGDDVVPAQVSTDYRALVSSRLGESHVNEFFRLFVIPGMAHCGGGSGADVLFHSEKANAVPIEPERDTDQRRLENPARSEGLIGTAATEHRRFCECQPALYEAGKAVLCSMFSAGVSPTPV
jgi:hypothetical protein